MHQWNNIEVQSMIAYDYILFIFANNAKNTQIGRKTALVTRNVTWKTECAHVNEELNWSHFYQNETNQIQMAQRLQCET